MFLSMQPRTVMSGRGATMTAVTRRTKKRAVMRRRGLTTVEEEIGSNVTDHQNLILTCIFYHLDIDLFDMFYCNLRRAVLS